MFEPNCVLSMYKLPDTLCLIGQRKQKQTTQKWANNLNKHLSKEDVLMST